MEPGNDYAADPPSNSPGTNAKPHQPLARFFKKPVESSGQIRYNKTNKKAACFQTARKTAYRLILRTTRSTRRPGEGPTPPDLRRRHNRLHNGIPSHTCGLLYTPQGISARVSLSGACKNLACVETLCSAFLKCLHSVFLVFSKAGDRRARCAQP